MAVNANYLDKKLFKAVKSGKIDLLPEPISRGASLEIRDFRGDTPLHVAARNGYKEIAEYLINSGVNLNVHNAEGETPLHIAARNGCKEIAEYLINSGADIQALDAQDRTPVGVANKYLDCNPDLWIPISTFISGLITCYTGQSLESIFSHSVFSPTRRLIEAIAIVGGAAAIGVSTLFAIVSFRNWRSRWAKQELDNVLQNNLEIVNENAIYFDQGKKAQDSNVSYLKSCFSPQYLITYFYFTKAARSFQAGRAFQEAFHRTGINSIEEMKRNLPQLRS